MKSAILFLTAMPQLGCPQLVFGIPAAMRAAPRFPGPEPAEHDAGFVPVRVDFETQGHALAFRVRVDGRNIEPTTGACRRWFLTRVARESSTTPRAFCTHDEVRFYLRAGVGHTLEFLVESQHDVAERILLSPGENISWRVPIATRRIELPVDLEPGYSYTIQGREELPNLASALPEDAPTGTRWRLDAHDPVFYSGVEVGSLHIRILRNLDRHVVSKVAAPLFSGRTSCEPPFCAVD